MGFEPIDREFERLGYDVESRVPETGKLWFIEVKGRVEGAPTITVTRNEILFSLNKPDDYILAIVEFLEKGGHQVHYLRQPFKREPDFGATGVLYDFADLSGAGGGTVVEPIETSSSRGWEPTSNKAPLHSADDWQTPAGPLR